jgi:hypothetical protein
MLLQKSYRSCNTSEKQCVSSVNFETTTHDDHSSLLLKFSMHHNGKPLHTNSSQTEDRQHEEKEGSATGIGH